MHDQNVYAHMYMLHGGLVSFRHGSDTYLQAPSPKLSPPPQQMVWGGAGCWAPQPDDPEACDQRKITIDDIG